MAAIMSAYDAAVKSLEKEKYTWLITGAAGFIGSHLLDFLLAHQQAVIALDNFSTGSQKNLDEVLTKYPKAHFEFVQGDIRDFTICQKIIKKVDKILHQAALGSVPRSIQDPQLTHDVNVNGFLNMLLAAKEAKVKRFVYASSSSVYGDSPILPKIETHQGNPLSPYAVTKMTDELYAKAFSTSYGIETMGLRYFNVFGPRQNPAGPYAAVIPLWIKALIRDEPVYINGDGLTSRDFCYVHNVVQANLLAALTHNQVAVNEVYNIAVNEQTTLTELYCMLKEFLAKQNHLPTYRDFRSGDIRHSRADIKKAQERLIYRPHYRIAEGLKETIAWYKERV